MKVELGKVSGSVYGQSSLSYTAVANWIAKFKHSTTSIAGGSHFSRSTTDEGTIEKFIKL